MGKITAHNMRQSAIKTILVFLLFLIAATSFISCKQTVPKENFDVVDSNATTGLNHTFIQFTPYPTVRSARSGYWTDSLIWVGGHIPDSTQDVEIHHRVTIPDNSRIKSHGIWVMETGHLIMGGKYPSEDLERVKWRKGFYEPSIRFVNRHIAGTILYGWIFDGKEWQQVKSLKDNPVYDMKIGNHVTVPTNNPVRLKIDSMYPKRK